MIQTTTGLNKHIELLRAYAVLLTVFLHFKTLVYFSSGNFLESFYSRFDLSVGVDLFLVISGYVITRSLCGTAYKNTANRKKLIFSFWIRRVYRLLPTAWLWLVFILFTKLLIAVFEGEVGALWADIASLAAAAFNFINVYFPYCLKHPEISWCTTSIYHPHYWSLSLEEQFYILFPLLLLFLKRPHFILLLILVIAAQFFLKRPYFSQLFYIKTDALCWGVLIYFFTTTNLYQQLRLFFSRHGHFSNFILYLGLILLLMIAAEVQGLTAGERWIYTTRSYGVGLVALMCAVVVLFASFESRIISEKSYYYRMMLYLGSRSYAIYVIHLIVFFMINNLAGYITPDIESTNGQFAFDISLCFIGLGLTLLLAEWNYRSIEKPWRLKGRKISTRMLEAKGH